MSAPATPKKTLIRRAIVALLERVRSGNGYWTEMGLNVASDRKPIQNHRAGELPRAVTVWRDTHPGKGGCVGPSFALVANFVVYVVLGGKRGDIQDLIDRTEQDVMRAVLSDLTLGGEVDVLAYVGTDTDQQVLVAEEAGAIVRAQIAVTFEVQYRATAATL